MAFGRSLLPFAYGNSFWDTWDYPSSTWDPYLDSLLDSDLYSPATFPTFSLRPKPVVKKDGLQTTKANFNIMVNVSHFKPDEIEVKMKDNYVEVHAKHEERSDEHGFIQREFTRRYLVPDTIDSEKLKSTLRPDGILIIEAPKKAIEALAANERIIPVAMLKPASDVEAKAK